jgi:hypothetical protein
MTKDFKVPTWDNKGIHHKVDEMNMEITKCDAAATLEIKTKKNVETTELKNCVMTYSGTFIVRILLCNH